MIRRSVVPLLLVVLALAGLPFGLGDIAMAAAAPVPFDPMIQLSVEPLYSVGSVATGDLNGDGRIDVLARGQQDVVYYQQPNGAPSLPVVVDPAPSSVLLRIADISGDGRNDVITSWVDGTLHAKLQKSDGTLAPDVPLPPTGQVIRMEVGDYTGDGRADIVVVTNTKSIQLLAQKVGGGLDAAVVIGTTPEFPTQVVLGDLDGDTKADLAMHWGTNYVYTFQQQGSGVLAAPVPVATGAAVGTVAFGRFNGDALVDMVVGRNGTFERVIYRKPDLSWSAPAGMGLPAGGGPATVRAADFNGDGKTDVAVFMGMLGVDLYQQGANGLDPAFQHIAHSSVNYGEVDSTAVADLNGDGAVDIASVSYEGQVNISSNARTNHAPVIAAANAQTSGTKPVSITTSATDADGHAVTWSLRTPPSHGTVTRSGATFTYTATSGYTGTDSFEVLADDGHRKYGIGKVGVYVYPFGHITGTVRDGFGPIPGLAVEAFDTSGALETTHTASDGTYHFDEIAQGPVYLWFHDTGNTFVSEWYRDAPSSVAATAISVYPGTTVVADALLMRVGAGGPLKVTTTADGVDGSLRQAIGWANANTAGDTIVLAAGATYTLTCAAGGALLSTDGHLTIEGHGATIKQTCPGERVLTASTSGPTTQGLTLSDVTLTGGDSSGNGGGVLAWGEVTLVDSTLTGNHAAGDGGGLWLGTYAAATLVRSRVASNTASSGGGLFMTNMSIDADSVVEGNEALQRGGGIATTSAQIKGTVRNNSALAGGGGGISAAGTTTIADGATVSGNHTTGDGGGVSAGSVTVEQATLANNDADERGGAIASTGRVAIGRATVSGNEAGSSGGGVHGDQVILELTSVQGNSAAVGGGVNAATLEAFAATVSGNSATEGGGFAGGSVSLSRSTVHGNSATGSGGAARLPFRGQLTSRFSTITANTAPSGPAFAWSEQGGITLIGSIVAPEGAGPACVLAGSTVTDSQYNFVPDTSCGNGSADTVGVDPQLGPLVAASGRPAVREPAAGSPVVDAIPLTVAACMSAGGDQRLLPRPRHGGCDTGSIERQPAGSVFRSVVPTRIADSRTGLGLSGAVGPAGATLPVAGDGAVAGLPTTGVSAVVLNVTATNGTANSFLTVHPAGAPTPTASNLNFAAGATVPNLVTVKVGQANAIRLVNASGTVDVVIDLVGYYLSDSAGGTFTPLTPARVVDSRTGLGLAAAVGSTPGEVKITGAGGVPDAATAVVLNVTATNATKNSFLTVYPTGEPQPTASNLNFAAGQTVPNLVVVRVGAGGKFSMANANGTTDVVADVVGYFSPDDVGSTFFPLPPTRALDTRSGVGIAGKVGSAAAPLQVAGAAGVPASGVTAVVINVTVTNPSHNSFLTLFPAGTSVPKASNLNFAAGQTIANLVVVKVGAGGAVNLTNAIGTTDVVGDVVGYYAAT